MPAPKKILIVITKGDVGGAQVFVHNLARSLKHRGCDVAVGMGEGAFLSAKLSGEHIPTFSFHYLKRSANPFAAILFALELKRFLKKNPYDLVQFNSSNSLPGALGAKHADKKIRTVFTVHGLSVLDKNYRTFPLMKFGYRLFFKFFMQYVDTAVFVDHHDREEAHRLGIVKGGAVIYNGFDESSLSFMPKDAARAAIAKNIGRDVGAAFIIGSIGRLSYQKNYEFLIRSFNDLLAVKPNAIAVVIGDGPERARCEELIRQLGLEEKFFLLGELNNAAQYLKAFDLFILPSRYEGLPITLTECLFTEVPVLASDVGGNREIASERSLYRFDDRADLIKKFTAAAENISGNLCDDNKKELFSLEKMADDYQSLL